MNERILSIRVTIQQMQRLLNALEAISEELPKDPRLYALMAEAPLDHLREMCHELDQHLTELKQVPAASPS